MHFSGKQLGGMHGVPWEITFSQHILRAAF